MKNCQSSIGLRQTLFPFLLATILACFSTKADGAPAKTTTIQVHVTDCEAPAAGAKIVIIDAGWEDNLASGTTNGAGDCSMKVRTGYNIVVQATYNGEVQKTAYFATDEKYGKQIVYVKFTGDCDDDQLPESATIKYVSLKWKSILTFDNYFKRYRDETWDSQTEGNPYHTVSIYNSLTRKSYEKHCDECDELREDDSGGDLVGMHTNYLLGSDEELLKQGYKQRTGKVIAGKKCSAWSMDIGPLYYKWKRIKMGEASHNGDKMFMEVKEITLNSSESAFLGL